MEGRSVSVIVELRDGRFVDVTSLSAEDAVAHLRALGTTHADVVRTIHRLPFSLKVQPSARPS